MFVSSKEQSFQRVMDQLYRTTCLVSQCTNGPMVYRDLHYSTMAMFPMEAQQVDAYCEGGEHWRSDGTSSAWQLRTRSFKNLFLCGNVQWTFFIALKCLNLLFICLLSKFIWYLQIWAKLHLFHGAVTWCAKFLISIERCECQIHQCQN